MKGVTEGHAWWAEGAPFESEERANEHAKHVRAIRLREALRDVRGCPAGPCGQEARGWIVGHWDEIKAIVDAEDR